MQPSVPLLQVSHFCIHSFVQFYGIFVIIMAMNYVDLALYSTDLALYIFGMKLLSVMLRTQDPERFRRDLKT